MEEKKRHRWFSFRLRTLFVAVTLLGCIFGWLAVTLQRVREREAVLAGSKWLDFWEAAHLFGWDPSRPGELSKPPLVWRWMGATPVQWTQFEFQDDMFTQEDYERCQRLFPEVRVVLTNVTVTSPSPRLRNWWGRDIGPRKGRKP